MKKGIDKFMDEAVEKIKGRLGSAYEVNWNIYHKNNGVSLKGIVITDRTSAVSPCIYMDRYYSEYGEKEDMEQIINDVICIYERNKGKEFLTAKLRDSRQMMDHVVFRLVNTERNKELLSRMPHEDLEGLGLSMILYVLFQTEGNQNAAMAVSNRLMQMWKVSKEELLEHAKKNTPLKMGYSMRSIRSVLGEYLGMKENGEMGQADFPRLYVLTNCRALYGAGCLIYDGLLENVANSLNSGFYVLPSSVHEVLLYPSSDMNDAAALKDIVMEINQTELAEEEILNDAVYYYDRKTKELSVA